MYPLLGTKIVKRQFLDEVGVAFWRVHPLREVGRIDVNRLVDNRVDPIIYK